MQESGREASETFQLNEKSKQARFEFFASTEWNLSEYLLS